MASHNLSSELHPQPQSFLTKERENMGGNIQLIFPKI